MGIGSFSDSELGVLNSKFSIVDARLSALEGNLKGEIAKIQAKVTSLKDTGTTILDQPTIQTLFDDVKKAFHQEQEKLKNIVEEFKKAATEYENMQYEVLSREEEIIKRECQADADFASKHNLLMAPIRIYQEKLEAKEQLLISIQQDECIKFEEREKKLVEDFKRLKQQQDDAFAAMQKELAEERENLAAREAAVSEREKKALEREIEIQEGLAQERSEMMTSIDVERNRLKEIEARLKDEELQIKDDRVRLNSDQSELQKRQDAIYIRECQADEDFANKRAQLQDDIEKQRKDCLDALRAEDEKASAHRTELLEETIKTAEAERARSIAAINAEMTQRRQEAEAEIASLYEVFQAEKDALQKAKDEFEQKSQELLERENKIKIEETRQASEKEFLAEKLRIDEEKFRKIAEAAILASQEEVKAVKAANDQLSSDLTSVRLKLEEQQSINNRFKDKSPEEIYNRLSELEQENDRLKTQQKNNRNH